MNLDAPVPEPAFVTPDRRSAETGSEATRLMAHVDRAAPWLLLALTITMTTAVRWRLLDQPLERDEGEYAYVAQWLCDGLVPYRDAYTLKLPGIHVVYAAMMAVLGQTPRAIHLGLLVANLVGCALVGWLGFRLLGVLGGAVAAAGFAVATLGVAVQGFSAHAEHFVLVPVLAGLITLLQACAIRRPWAFFVAGLLLGCGLVIKQHAAVFVIFGGAYALRQLLTQNDGAQIKAIAPFAAFVLGAALPWGATCALLWAAGAFEPFWFWTVTYAAQYVTDKPLGDAPGPFLARTGRIVGGAPLLWAMVAVGVTAIAWDAEVHARRLFLLGLVAVGLLATVPGYYFRPHYFVLLMPGAALCAGAAAHAIGRLCTDAPSSMGRRLIPSLIAAVALSTAAYQQRMAWFRLEPDELCRATYPGNPFVESLPIGRFLRIRSTGVDRVAVLGSEPQLLFYAHRRSASGYLYMYPMMERHPFAGRMQDEMISQVEAAAAPLVVVVNNPLSWQMRPDSDRRIVEWLDRYLEAHYETVGLVEMSARGATKAYWDAAARGRRPTAARFIRIYRRLRDVPPADGDRQRAHAATPLPTASK